MPKVETSPLRGDYDVDDINYVSNSIGHEISNNKFNISIRVRRDADEPKRRVVKKLVRVQPVSQESADEENEENTKRTPRRRLVIKKKKKKRLRVSNEEPQASKPRRKVVITRKRLVAPVSVTTEENTSYYTEDYTEDGTSEANEVSESYTSEANESSESYTSETTEVSTENDETEDTTTESTSDEETREEETNGGEPEEEETSEQNQIDHVPDYEPFFPELSETLDEPVLLLKTTVLSSVEYVTKTTTTSRLRTYTFVVTRVNGDEQVVTSTTEVRPQTKVITLTEPLTKLTTLTLLDFDATSTFNPILQTTPSPQLTDPAQRGRAYEEARYNLATRVMSNGVEVIVAGDKSTLPGEPDVKRVLPSTIYKPVTLKPSTLSGNMMMLLPQEASNPNQFVTKTCLTTFTYLTTYLESGTTTVSSHEQVVSNVATEERNTGKILPTPTMGITLTQYPNLSVGVFHTTYTYLNTILDGEQPLVVTSKHTVTNTVTAPDDYLSMLQPNINVSAIKDTNTYYSTVSLQKTLYEGQESKVVSTNEVVTQVVITESVPPKATSVMTSYIALDVEPDPASVNYTTTDVVKTYFVTYTYQNTLLENGNTVVHTSVSTSSDVVTEKLFLHPKRASTIKDKKHKIDLSGEHFEILATKTYHTTFTYFTTLLQEDNSASPTVISSNSRIVENVVTETIDSSLLDKKDVKAIRSGIKSGSSTITKLATLHDGQKLEITVIAKDITPTKVLPIEKTVMPSSVAVETPVEIEASSTPSVITGSTIIFLDDEPSQETPALTSTSAKVVKKTKTVTSTSKVRRTTKSKTKTQAVEPTKAIAKKPATKLAKPPTSQVTDLLGLGSINVQALKPVLSAMADLIQTNLKSNRRNDTITTKSNTRIGTTFIPTTKMFPTTGRPSPKEDPERSPIYIPVGGLGDELEIAESQNVATFHLQETVDWKGNKVVTKHESPLLNGGIPISPGDVITANSDVIVGKPGRILPRVPSIPLNQVHEDYGLQPPPVGAAAPPKKPWPKRNHEYKHIPVPVSNESKPKIVHAPSKDDYVGPPPPRTEKHKHIPLVQQDQQQIYAQHHPHEQAYAQSQNDYGVNEVVDENNVANLQHEIQQNYENSLKHNKVIPVYAEGHQLHGHKHGGHQPSGQQFGDRQVIRQHFGEHQVNKQQFGKLQPNGQQFGGQKPNGQHFDNHQQNGQRYGDHQLSGPQFGDRQVIRQQFGEHHLNEQHFGDQQPSEQQFGNQQLNEQQFGDQQLSAQQFGDHQLNGQQFGDHQLNGQQFGDRQVIRQQFGEHQQNEQHFGDQQPSEQQFGNQQLNGQHFGDQQLSGQQFGNHQLNGQHFGDQQPSGQQFRDQLSDPIKDFNLKPSIVLPEIIERSTGQPLLVNIQPSQVAFVNIPHNRTTALIYGGSTEPHKNGQYFDDPSPYPEPEFSGIEFNQNGIPHIASVYHDQNQQQVGGVIKVATTPIKIEPDQYQQIGINPSRPLKEVVYNNNNNNHHAINVNVPPISFGMVQKDSDFNVHVINHNTQFNAPPISYEVVKNTEQQHQQTSNNEEIIDLRPPIQIQPPVKKPAAFNSEKIQNNDNNQIVDMKPPSYKPKLKPKPQAPPKRNFVRPTRPTQTLADYMTPPLPSSRRPIRPYRPKPKPIPLSPEAYQPLDEHEDDLEDDNLTNDEGEVIQESNSRPLRPGEVPFEILKASTQTPPRNVTGINSWSDNTRNTWSGTTTPRPTIKTSPRATHITSPRTTPRTTPSSLNVVSYDEVINHRPRPVVSNPRPFDMPFVRPENQVTNQINTYDPDQGYITFVAAPSHRPFELPDEKPSDIIEGTHATYPSRPHSTRPSTTTQRVLTTRRATSRKPTTDTPRNTPPRTPSYTPRTPSYTPRTPSHRTPSYTPSNTRLQSNTPRSTRRPSRPKVTSLPIDTLSNPPRVVEHYQYGTQTETPFRRPSLSELLNKERVTTPTEMEIMKPPPPAVLEVPVVSVPPLEIKTPSDQEASGSTPQPFVPQRAPPQTQDILELVPPPLPPGEQDVVGMIPPPLETTSTAAKTRGTTVSTSTTERPVRTWPSRRRLTSRRPTTTTTTSTAKPTYKRPTRPNYDVYGRNNRTRDTSTKLTSSTTPEPGTTTPPLDDIDIDSSESAYGEDSTMFKDTTETLPSASTSLEGSSSSDRSEATTSLSTTTTATKDKTVVPTRFVTHTKTSTVTITKTTVVKTPGGPPSTRTLLVTKTEKSTLVDTVTEIHTLVQPTSIFETVTTTIKTSSSLYPPGGVYGAVSTYDIQPTKTPLILAVPTVIPEVIPAELPEDHNDAAEEEDLSDFIISDTDPPPVHDNSSSSASDENESIFVVMTDKKHGGIVKVPPNASYETQDRDEMLNNNEVNNVLLGGILIANPPTVEVPKIRGDRCEPECKASRNELCHKVEGLMRCVCRPGFARMFPDRPCNPTYTYALKVDLERIGRREGLIKFDPDLYDPNSTEFAKLTSITHEALDRMVMQSDLRDIYHGVHVNAYEPSTGRKPAVSTKFYLQLSDNTDETRLVDVFKKYLRNNNYSLGGTEVYAARETLDNLQARDFDECTDNKYHDCSENAQCFNLKGTYTCSCKEGFADLSENTLYPGRICSAELIGCERCNYHGTCYSRGDDQNFCECFQWYTGQSCHINLKVLLIALVTLGAILFVLLMICLIMTCARRKPRQSRMAAAGMSFLPQRASSAGTMDRRAMIQDTSSEDSRSETNLPYVQQKQKQKKQLLLKGALKKPSSAEETTQIAFSDQKDRSLTVMIPRAKYHPAPPTSPLVNYTSFDARKPSVPSTSNEAKLLSYLDAGPSPGKPDNIQKSRRYSNNSGSYIDEKPGSRKTSGALISAGFEVSATVLANNMGTIGTTCGTEADRSENATLIQKISAADLLSSTGTRSQFNTLRKSLVDNDIDPMANWMDISPRINTVSEARSYDETTIPPPMKSFRNDYDSKPSSQHHNDEANTMAERDLGSTFLLPHTHLYKPDRGSDISGFESL